MAERFVVQYSVHVIVTIENKDILERIKTTDWQEIFYKKMSEEEVADMLAISCGIDGVPIDHLDGWADCDPEDVKFNIEYVLDSVLRIPDDVQE